jgi:DNA-directed RNA polymerase subunit RPC12/RpoP
VTCAAKASPPPPLDMADIFRTHEKAYRRSHTLTPDQDKAWHALLRCRTSALGGHLYACDHCGHEVPMYNSCRNRHCPKCQGLAQAKWIAEREEHILPVCHFHVVFTLPAELHRLVLFRREILFNMLFACASRTLLELGRDEDHLGAQLGFSAVLHTWTRELLFHPHLHCIVTGGGLSNDGSGWIHREKFLFHVDVMGALFRGKFLDALRRAHAEGVFAGFDDFVDPEGFDHLMRSIAAKNDNKKWGVYSKRAFGGAEQVYRYLGRYTHRVGIANSRLVEVRNDSVTFRTKNGKTVTVTPVEFIRRFLLHVLPAGYVKMRHYGLFAPANVNTKLKRARALLAASGTTSTAPAQTGRQILEALTGDEAPRCPVCGIGILRWQMLMPRDSTSAVAETEPPDTS